MNLIRRVCLLPDQPKIGCVCQSILNDLDNSISYTGCYNPKWSLYIQKNGIIKYVLEFYYNDNFWRCLNPYTIIVRDMPSVKLTKYEMRAIIKKIEKNIDNKNAESQLSLDELELSKKRLAFPNCFE